MMHIKELNESAAAEKVFAAEKNVSLVRIVVIVLNVFVYLVMMAKQDTIPWLAYAISGVASAYALAVLFFQPYRRYPIFLASYFTYTTDAVLITLWLLATGGYESPFYLLWYLSITAVAFRFSPRITVFTSILYSACYLLMLALIGELQGHAVELTLRTGYIIIAGYLGTLISKEMLDQTIQKRQMQRLAKEAREAEERLQLQTQLYESLLNAQSELGEGVSIIENSRFIYVNDALCNIYGYSEKELLELPSFLDIIAPEERKSLKEKLQKRLSGTELPFSGRTIVINKSGQSVNIAYSVKMIRRNGKQQLFSIVRDITEEIRSKEDLEQRTLDLERTRELERQKDEFIGVASHELKTPLTSLKGYVQLLQRTLDNSGDATAQLYATKTNIHIDRLNKLVSDLLDSSRIHTGKLQLNITSFDINEMVAEVVESMQHTSQTHTIRYAKSISQAVHGDRMRLEQVLTNLITNAIKYSPKSKEVIVSVERKGEDVVVAVKDFGLGIPEMLMDKIFERFFRVDSHAGSVPGLGIGLYISAELVKRHRGRIWAESKEGEGSVFYFSLPIA